MNNELELNSYWYLITIEDPRFLKGESIFNVIQTLLKVIKLKFVILNDINGSSKTNGLIATLQEQENTVIKLDYFLDIINDVKQFDWGDFFLFREYPINWNSSKSITYYPEFIKFSDTTVRAVDNQYIYIYTPYEMIVEIVQDDYKIESIKKDNLENLDYPY